ncbi:MAG: WXG100 family type VII secretion target [Actinobacteria bacterium]|nr:WXG100 family type VII secretion target [Actinomycetota bacterium]
MPNLLVSPEELRSHANNVKTRATSSQADFNTLRSQVQALSVVVPVIFRPASRPRSGSSMTSSESSRRPTASW